MGLNVKSGVCLGFAILLLAACSSKTEPDIAPSEPIVQEPLAPLPSGPLSAAQISAALGEKTFRFSGGNRQGTVTYYKDGTFSYEEDGKGAGTGIWQASDGKLCEARNPTSFLPKGTPSTCTPITSDGTKFTAGLMQLQPA